MGEESSHEYRAIYPRCTRALDMRLVLKDKPRRTPDAAQAHNLQRRAYSRRLRGILTHGVHVALTRLHEKFYASGCVGLTHARI